MMGITGGTEESSGEALEAGDGDADYELGVLLHWRGDLAGAEAAYRRADQRGDATAAYGLGALLHRRGCETEAEAAYRRAIAGGYSNGWLGVGVLLEKQRGREAEAEAAYRKTIDAGASGKELEMAAFKLGDLLARRGDVAGAYSAYEVAMPLVVERVAKRVGVDPADPCFASCAAKGIRFRTAVVRRPWARRLTHSIHAVVARLGSALSSTWQRARGRAT